MPTDVRPIPATWLGITAWQGGQRESYELSFYTDEGRWLEGLQFESLDIALDQAADIVGVRPDEWEEMHLVLREDDEGARWVSTE